MIKILLFCGVLGFAQDAFMHQYKVREIPSNIEGVLFTECMQEPNDTVKVFGKQFVVLNPIYEDSIMVNLSEDLLPTQNKFVKYE